MRSPASSSASGPSRRSTPPTPNAERAIEEIERFGDEDLQHRIRQIFLWAMRRQTASLRSFLEGAKIGLPHGLAVKTAGPFIALDGRSHSADDANTRHALSLLPGMLQRIDDWIAQGILDGEHLNAADFQLAPSLRLAMSFDDLRPAIENRPAGRLALRVVPHYPGRIPPTLPTTWLQPLHPHTSAHRDTPPRSNCPAGSRRADPDAPNDAGVPHGRARGETCRRRRAVAAAV